MDNNKYIETGVVQNQLCIIFYETTVKSKSEFLGTLS